MPSGTDAPGTIPDGSTLRWKDEKRYLWLIALVMPSLAFAALGLHAQQVMVTCPFAPAGRPGHGTPRRPPPDCLR